MENKLLQQTSQYGESTSVKDFWEENLTTQATREASFRGAVNDMS